MRLPPRGSAATSRLLAGLLTATLLTVTLLLAGLLAPGPARAVDPDDLLPVDQAFALSASAAAGDGIALRWRIADGYYLYRHRIAVKVTGGGFQAGALRLPDGKRHTDEFFGEVETYRRALTATLPGTPASGTGNVTLEVKYQGCADLGVCYPPQTRTLSVALPTALRAGPAAASGMDPLVDAAPSNGSGSLLPGSAPVASLLGGRKSDPLPPEQAFGFEAIAGDAGTLLLRFTPATGYYLYRDKTRITLDGPAVAAGGLAPGRLQWPRGTSHHDEYFGTTTVFFDQVDVRLPLRRTGDGGGRLQVTAAFQGCQTDGICYPPMTRTVVVALPAGPPSAAAGDAGQAPGRGNGVEEADAAGASAEQAVAAFAQGQGDYAEADLEAARQGAQAAAVAADMVEGVIGGAGAPSSPASAPDLAEAEDTRLAAALAGTSRWWVLLGFLGAGLLLAFTPCVLPMIPILSGLIAGASAGHGGRLGTGRALALSSVYVLASALVFTVAGVVAGLVGANLQVAFQTPWVIAAFSLLFVALALSMFGLYELQLPAALRARLGAMADRQRGGHWAGVATMGALSALIVGPCVAPPLAAAVLYIGQTRDPVFGGAALFLLAIGMGLPLLGFGVAAGRGLPTSGPWMVGIQRVFGFVFLGLAIWMLSRILPGTATLALWGLLALAAAAWAFGLATPASSERGRLLARFAGLLLAVAGAAQLLGAASGGHDPLRPLARLAAGGAEETLQFRMIKSAEDLDREVAAARAAGRPLLFDFYADWCVSCKEMEKYTFTDPGVRAALDGFVLLKADVTANDAVDQALMQRYGIIGPPATLFFRDGGERRGLRLIGFEKATPFLARIQRATAAPVAAGQE